MDMESMRRMLKERNAALFSLDRRRIEKYMAKYGEPIPKNISDMYFGDWYIRRYAV